ncbi:MAG: bacillithiol biosynthesis deacetylase BshB1 [Calditrichaeota bacterium]|nr:bacillithiol biosynthesis deacetylase BshB1 [Calditrichota bacterium]
MKNSEKTLQIDILAFGAHPDDVELGCGGSLFKLKKLGYRTGIVDLTEGELGSRGTVAERYKEAAESAEILEVDERTNLKIPDGQILNNQENRKKIIRLIRKHQPVLIIAPYPEDRHPDHGNSSRLITEAWFFSGVKKVLPEIPPHRPFRVLYYMAKYEFEPSFVMDITGEFDTKFRALQAYKSQFYNPEWPEEQTFISSRWFMDSVEFRARHFGWMAGVKYGEPFWIREPLALDDPVPIFSRKIL